MKSGIVYSEPVIYQRPRKHLIKYEYDILYSNHKEKTNYEI